MFYAFHQLSMLFYAVFVCVCLSQCNLCNFLFLCYTVFEKDLKLLSKSTGFIVVLYTFLMTLDNQQNDVNNELVHKECVCALCDFS